MKKSVQKNAFVLLFQGLILSLVPVELYRTFLSDTISVGPISLQEAFLFLAVGILFCGAVFYAVLEKKKKALWAFSAWAAVFLAYLVLHAHCAAAFNAALVPAASPDFGREAYYVLRMYGLPALVFWSAVLLEVPAQKIVRSLLCVLWMTAGLIVITTLFGISFASYADGNQIVRGGYCSWLTPAARTFSDMFTSKGPFHSANDLASVLFGLSPIAFYTALHRGKARDFVLLFFVGVSCVTVGTKIASLGFFVIVIAQGFCAVFQHAAARVRTPIPARRAVVIAGVFCAVVVLFLISPGRQLQQQRDAEQTETFRPTDSIAEVDDALSSEGDELTARDAAVLADYLDEHAYDHFINKWFLDIYPVENDPVFWADAVRRDGAENADSRAFKLRLIDRVIERNAHPADRFFGIGFTSGVPYAERDYLYQYDIYGMVGVLVLIAPVIGLFCAGAALLLYAVFKRRETPLLLASCLSAAAFLGTAYFAGHVFDTPYPTYLLFCVSALFIRGRGSHETK